MTNSSSEAPIVLLVDDDAAAVRSLSRALGQQLEAASIFAATTAEKALELQQSHQPSVAVVDLSLDPSRGVESGLELIRTLVQSDASCRCIVLTGHGGIEYGVRAMRAGAAHFLEKPAEIEHLAVLVRDAAQQSVLRRAVTRFEEADASLLARSFVGESSEAQRVREAIRYAASTAQAVLLLGETGTGKGVCARLIHQLSARAKGPFVRYQPNLSSADMVQSELFGHVRGAFTGANHDRQGLLAEAARGTLFLDEIEELPPATQVALLGALQERTFRAVGASAEQRADFRLVCASNGDVQQDIERGKLRLDFYHRIAHFVIQLPALRDRLSDIPLLVRHTLNELQERDSVAVTGCDDDALAVLTQHRWPGNVRELAAVVEGAAYRAQFAGRRIIEQHDVQLSVPLISKEEGSFHEQVEAFKLRVIRQALERCGGNQVQAAKLLGLDRSSMRRILARQGE